MKTLSEKDKQTIEEIVYSEQEAIKELLETQQILRKQKEAYLERNERQYNEVNDAIDLHQKNILKLKKQLSDATTIQR